jgi:hypothetical protein
MKHHFITLTPGQARALMQELQAVLDGHAAYFHAELSTHSGLDVGLHLSAEQGHPIFVPQSEPDDWDAQADADQWGERHG